MTLGLTATEIVTRIAAGELTAAACVDALLARCRAMAHLNAFITIDENQVREAAAARDAERRSGAKLRPLHGLPVVVKDNIYTAGLPTTGGTRAFANFRPGRDASTVRALLDQGAIVLGKTNLHELAFGVTSKNEHFGAVGNPYDAARISGGSSGGTAAAIGGLMAPAGLGTDTGGSTRIPAAHCGIAGFRPSAGRYAGDGVMTMSRTRDTVGPMASDVGGLRLLDGAMAFGIADRPITVRIDELRLGYPRRMIEELAAPEMSAAVAGIVATLAEAGATIIEIELAEVVGLNARASIPIAIYEVRREWTAFLAETLGIGLAEFAEGLGSPDVRHIFGMVAGAPLPEAVYADAVGSARQGLRDTYGRCFATNGLTAIIRPTTPVTAAPIETCDTVKVGGETIDIFAALTRFVDPSSIAGIPSVTVPAGLLGAMPFGIDLDGPFGSDDALLAAAAAIEAVLGRLPAPAPV